MGNSLKRNTPACSDSDSKASRKHQDKVELSRSINFRKISAWNLGSLSNRLNWSFSGQLRSHSSLIKSNREKYGNRSNSSRHYRKTTWPTPHTDSIFLSHFKRISRNEEFVVEDVIAQGAFGIVFKVEKKHHSEEQYALKVLKKSKIIQDNSLQQIKDEVDIQKLCGHHPFIVKHIDSWQNKSNLHILLEYIAEGELFNKLCKFPDDLIRLYIAEISLAIDFLHNAGVIYRDVKPENILLSKGWHIKLTDFGLSKWLKFGERTRTMCGTFQYMAASKRKSLSSCSKMNTRSQVFDLACEGRQVDEAVSSIFHTVLFHRCQGKFEYGETDESYTMGTIGFTDIDCHFIDFTYVCVSSDILRDSVKSAVSLFSEKLRSDESTGTGQISLEFFQKKKRSALLGTIECVPWEVWTVKIEIVNYENEDDRQMGREIVSETLSDKVIYIAEVMNRYDYVPRTPAKSELDWVYNTQIPEVQPYLFKIDHSTSSAVIPSVGSAVKKIIRETLSL